jgi:IclR family pca regulon transcriptional regulator
MPAGQASVSPRVHHDSGVPTLREARFSQSLERGLAILSCFTAEHSVMGIADIADDLGMSRSTTHRYMITLVALGYLEQGPSRKYRLGLRVSDLGMAALDSNALRQHSGPCLEELRRRTSYTVNVAILDGAEIIYVARARGFRRGQFNIDLGLGPGSRLPAYCTAMGKLLIANLPDRDQRHLVAELTLRKRGPNTITSKRNLRAELEQVRHQNFAINDQELAPGLLSISALVRSDTDEVVAAVNMAAHRSMIGLEELVDRFGPDVIATADRISERLREPASHTPHLAGS